MEDIHLNFQAQDKNIGEIIRGTEKKFKIPRYQRPYAWGKEETLDFWNDIIGEDREYFIGSLIFNYEYEDTEGVVEIIDGQQRLLTITILAAAIRDLAHDLGEQKYADKVQREWIVFEDLEEKEFVRILCGDSTRPFFEKYIQYKKENILNILDYRKLTKEEQRIYENYIFIRNSLGAKISGFSDTASKKECLSKIIKKIDNLKIIWIKIQSDTDAYTIFENVNARGLELSVGDLLKNAIFKEFKTENNVASANKIWKEISNNIQSSGWELTKFIRYYWLSKYEHIQEKKLFKEIKKKFIADKTFYKTFLDDLADASKLFKLIVAGEEDDFFGIKQGDGIYRALEGIRTMEVSQCFVFFMSLLRNAHKIEQTAAPLFEFVENFSFNYSTICKMPGNQVEKIYSKHAIELENIISNKETKEKDRQKNLQRLITKIQGKLRGLLPPVEFFEQKFQEVSYKNSEKNRALLRYMLSKMNNAKSTDEMKIDFNNVNIEHILPQNPSEDWKLEKKDIEEYVNKLGNLTLVSMRINKRAGNKNIKEKVRILEGSRILLTEEAVEHIIENKYTWGRSDIEERQKAFCDLAYNNVWSISK